MLWEDALGEPFGMLQGVYARLLVRDFLGSTLVSVLGLVHVGFVYETPNAECQSEQASRRV